MGALAPCDTRRARHKAEQMIMNGADQQFPPPRPTLAVALVVAIVLSLVFLLGLWLVYA
jgi:type IV secretory pathway TrbD component